MTDETYRMTKLERLDEGVYLATNVRGGTLRFGSNAGQDFSPVELLLAAIGGCTAVDVDVVTGRRAEAEEFEVLVEGHKVRDAHGSRMQDLTVTFTLRFPEGEAGDAARDIVPRAVKTSHDKTCTVSRTVELGTPVSIVIEE